MEMQESEAFKSLTKSAIRVLLYAHFFEYYAATKTDGRSFKFTTGTARDKLGMTPQTFNNCKNELAEKGFLRWVQRGGLRGCNGKPSRFVLTDDWKTWKPLKN